MKIEDITAISGKSGLYKIIKPTRSGVIIESLDEKKHRLVINSTNKISVLKDISIYTTTAEGSISLKQVFEKIYEKIGNDCKVNIDSTADELTRFMEQVLPEYDVDRVYISDIKKLVNWYNVLLLTAPEILSEKEITSTEDNKSE